MSLPTKKEKKEVEEWFGYLRDLICESFENIEKELAQEILFGLDEENIKTQTQSSTINQILSEVEDLNVSSSIREEFIL